MMLNYVCRYKTPGDLDDLLMRSDGEFLTGLWFEGSKDAIKHQKEFQEADLPIFDETRKWLDAYFGGNPIKEMPKMKIENLTDFRKEVMEIMMKIPYGKTVSYGDIAKKIAEKRKIRKMSSRAVGQAVGWNPVCIIIPCHRVIGSDGSITGYGGGINNKKILLEIEKR